MRLLLPLLAFCLLSTGLLPAQTKPAPEWKGRIIRLSDFGSDDVAYLTLPETPPRFGVVLVHDESGLGRDIRLLADSLAARGITTVAPDLFNGKQPDSPAQAALFQQQIRPESAARAIQAAVKLLHESPKFRSGPVLVTAFGPQANVTLYALERDRTVSGLTWCHPSGTLDTRRLRRIDLPIQIVHGTDPAQIDFLARYQDGLPEGRQRLTTIVPTPLSGHALLRTPAASAEPWKAIHAFWEDCLGGAYTERRGLFRRLLGE
jgi:dienelactone hydrolase